MKRLLAVLPLRAALGVIEALTAGAADAFGRISVLCREVSKATEKDLKKRPSTPDRFQVSVMKDIDQL